MKDAKCGVSREDLKRGYENGEYEGNDGVVEEPMNSQWKDRDDGGFLGREKGQER
jgi:hypothetical protein